MLERKFAQYLEQFLSNEPNKILLVNGVYYEFSHFSLNDNCQIL